MTRQPASSLWRAAVAFLLAAALLACAAQLLSAHLRRAVAEGIATPGG
jgi:hypothetical protein